MFTLEKTGFDFSAYCTLISPTGRGSMYVPWPRKMRMYWKNTMLLLVRSPPLPTSVADAKEKFRIRFRIRIGLKLASGSEFESGFESRIWIRIRILDADPAQKLAKTFFFVLNFYQTFSLNIIRLPSLSSVTWILPSLWFFILSV